MKTKFLIIVLVFAVLVPQASAQKRRKNRNEVSIGLFGGINIQNLYGKNSNGDNLNYKLMPEIHAGGNINLPVMGDLFIQPGLLLSNKGARQEIITEQIRTTKLYYIEVPLNLLYRPQIGDGHILLGCGPYAAYGIKGKEINSPYGTVPVRFLNEADLSDNSYIYYKPFDAGINLLVGFEMFNGIFINLNTQLGLLKVNSYYTEDQASKKNIGFGLSGGYRF